jgi:hypothetical protein
MYGRSNNESHIERARKKYALSKEGAKYFSTIFLRIFLDLSWKSEEEVFDRACKAFEVALADNPHLSEASEDSE